MRRIIAFAVAVASFTPMSTPAQVLAPAGGGVLHDVGDASEPAARLRSTSLRDVRVDGMDLSRLRADARIADAEVPPALPIKPKSKADWYRLSALQPGQVISVDVAGKRRMTGPLIAVDDASVTLETIYGPQRVERTDVLRISAAATRRMKTAGFVTAAGAGLLLAHLASAGEEPLPSKFSLLGLPAFVVGVGLIGKEKPRTGEIYRKP